MNEEEKNKIDIETRLRVEINLFRYFPLFIKETEVRLINKKGNILTVQSLKEDKKTFSLIKLSSFPISFFVLNLIILSGIIGITFYYTSKAGDWLGMAIGGATGTALGTSLFHIDDLGKRLRKRIKPLFPSLAIVPVFSALLLVIYFLGSGTILYTTYKLTGSLVWISYSVEFFALSLLLSPVVHYLRHKNKLFLIKEEEGFIVIAHSVIKVPKRVHESEPPSL